MKNRLVHFQPLYGGQKWHSRKVSFIPLIHGPSIFLGQELKEQKRKKYIFLEAELGMLL